MIIRLWFMIKIINIKMGHQKDGDALGEIGKYDQRDGQQSGSKNTTILTLIHSASPWILIIHLLSQIYSYLTWDVLASDIHKVYSLTSLRYKCELIQEIFYDWPLLGTSHAWPITTSLSLSVPSHCSTVFHGLTVAWHYLFIVYCLSPM